MKTVIQDNQTKLNQSIKENPHEIAAKTVLSSVSELISHDEASRFSKTVRDLLTMSLCTEYCNDANYRGEIIHHVEYILDFLTTIENLEKDEFIRIYLPRLLEETKEMLVFDKNNENEQ